MLPFRHVGAPKPEHWLGLIDATYAIAMTVLALLLPDILGDAFRQFEETRKTFSLLISLYLSCFYFLSLLIFYTRHGASIDALSYYRALKVDFKIQILPCFLGLSASYLHG